MNLEIMFSTRSLEGSQVVLGCLGISKLGPKQSKSYTVNTQCSGANSEQNVGWTHNCPQIIHQFHQVLGCNNNIPNEIPEQNTKNFIIRRSSITPHTLIIIAGWDLGHSSNFSGYLVPQLPAYSALAGWPYTALLGCRLLIAAAFDFISTQ